MNFIKKLPKLNLVRLLNLAEKDRRLIALLAIGVFLLGNLMVSFVSLRADLSYGHAYTLSDSSKNILRKLDDVVTIKFFVSSELPSQLSPLRADVVDLLNEYKKIGGSKINLKVLDPNKDEVAKSEATEANIPELQFSSIEKDKYAVTAARFGIALSYGSKKSSIPQVTNIENLEYNLTSGIYKMTNKEPAKIGIVGYPPSYNPQEDQLGPIKNFLQQQFNVDYVEVSTGSASIDKSYGALMVFDNREKPFNSMEVKAIKEYLNNKGNAIFFVDGVWVLDNLSSAKADNGLAQLLSEYGIKVKENLLLSTSSEFVNFGNSTLSFMAPYPFWLKTNVFNKKTSYFSNVPQLTFPWVSQIELEKKSGYTVTDLVKTTNRSWQESGNFTLSPESIKEPKLDELRDFIIAAQSSGTNKGKVIVISSSRFILAQFLSKTSGNVALVMNVLSEMAAKGELSGMSQRAVQFYPVPDMPEQKKDLFKYLNILLLPVALSLYGAYRLMRRK